MGGIFFMSRLLILLISSFISGYLYVNWMPIPDPFYFTGLILGFVFNPVKVFAATIAFITGFITSGIFIREMFYRLKRSKKQKNRIIQNTFLLFLFFISSYYLYMIGGIWEVTLFFSFIFLYGMMTIEKH